MPSPSTRSPRNTLPQHNVSDVSRALKSKDTTFLNEVRDTLDLIDLDGDYEGVVVEKSHYSPDDMGRGWAVEILRDVIAHIDDERAEVLEGNGRFNRKELVLLKKYVIDEMAINSDGANATLWFAELGDETGTIIVAFFQYEDGAREFWEFAESRKDSLSRFSSEGTKIV